MPAAKGTARTPLGPIVATFVSACSQGQRTHSPRTKNTVNSGHLVPWQRTQATRTKIYRETISAGVLILSATNYYVSEEEKFQTGLQTIWFWLIGVVVGS